jgi:hypothetical protein
MPQRTESAWVAFPLAMNRGGLGLHEEPAGTFGNTTKLNVSRLVCRGSFPRQCSISRQPTLCKCL